MTDAARESAGSLPLELEQEIDRLRGEFERACRSGEQPRIEDSLGRIAEAGRESLLRKLILAELEFDRGNGTPADMEDYCRRFPDDERIVVDAFVNQVGAASWNPSTTTNRFAADGDSVIDVAGIFSQDAEDAPLPQQIGRYAVRRRLGRGSFGDVYLAYDPDLDRLVALKVPRAEQFPSQAAIDGFLDEARIAARLDHPGIVKVYDVRHDSGTVVIVLEFVEGRTLEDAIAAERFTPERTAGLMAEIADAVNFANEARLVQRDLKPANVLLDKQGRPHVADFGSAIHADAQRLRKGEIAGSPAYMAPEQVRGETHRLDGRTDQWSLGVILYEMLSGRRPFNTATTPELFDEIEQRDPQPPGQIDPNVPPELERICLKCLSKRMSDRYPTVGDLAADLRHWLETRTSPAKGSAAKQIEERPQVIPKGLRSFDEHDADFFLELLPGPRDRDGLPDGIRFWKTRIEETDADKTFSVGLIYGPSGCGKSSLVKAGLLPRLGGHVCPVYVEATADDTEVRLLNGLRKHCPQLPQDMPLPDVFAALREGRWLEKGKKVLVVLDQFEQWLHAGRGEMKSQLIDALRHCDGSRVQCIVMVRDDFWMAATRFMRELEVRLVEAENSAAVDLFPERHARKVLAAFGRALGALPDNPRDFSKDQTEFLQQSVAGLSVRGTVICVRLALIAEMMKGKSWTPGTLKEVGGTEGIGVNFLEETFSASTAPPEHRLHQKAARAVLKALLPESGSNIKGHMCSYDELLEASGYSRRPQDFDELIGILDSEIRLITPTDPEGAEAADGEPDASASGSLTKDPARYYHLTHDYLVPSLRDWLTRKQTESRRGRTELKLEERSRWWNHHRENRYLPNVVEYLAILYFTPKRNWTKQQRRMMKSAGTKYLLQAAFATLLALIVVVSGFGSDLARVSGGLALLLILTVAGGVIRRRAVRQQNKRLAAALVQRLFDAEIRQLPTIIEEINDYRTWIDPLLRQALQDPTDSRISLHAGLALLPVDDTQVDFLAEVLLSLEPAELPSVRDALVPHKQQVTGPLWDVLYDETGESARRFRAACSLAAYDRDNETKWKPVLPFVADQLVETLTHGPRDFAVLLKSLEPIAKQLTEPVALIVRNGKTELQQETALNVVLEYAADDPQQLTEVLVNCEQRQFGKTFAKLAAHKSPAVRHLGAVLNETWKEETPEPEKERIAKRQANVAVALLKLGQSETVWPVLKQSSDPRTRTYVIHWAAPLGVDPSLFVNRFETESDVSIRRALLLAMGGFAERQRAWFAKKLLSVYETEPDPGLHGCAEWLLRKWGHGTRVEELTQKLQTNEASLVEQLKESQRRWYVTTEGHTMAMLEADTFRMGSPESDPGHDVDEITHLRKIGRTFAIAAHEVTKQQFRCFQQKNPHVARDNIDQYSRTGDSPQIGVTWYDAAAYCNWLSETEGIPQDQWCYEKNAEGKYAEGMKAKSDYLQRTGYRLPTEAEWEYACRAGTATSRYYGLTATLLPEYARYQDNGENHPWPVGGLRPNGFGLFDMLGNALEWCHDAYSPYPVTDPRQAAVETPDVSPVSDAGVRVLRGGSFNVRPVGVRSASRIRVRPSLQNLIIGFRPARSCR